MDIDYWYESSLEMNEALAEFDINIWEENRVILAEGQEDAMREDE